jgi:nucleoside-diphosphate-sugar epimerase
MNSTSLLAFGCGYVATALALRLAGAGWRVGGTVRTSAGVAGLRPLGVAAHVWTGSEALDALADAWLISVPPDDAGCPVWRSFSNQASKVRWIGYLSTTGVYGDLQGRWAFEESERRPLSPEAVNRARAEDQWLSAGAEVFRLPGIYGPGRSALDRVREPNARRIHKAGQVFSRAHRDDIAAALQAAIVHPSPGAIYNICDDEPAPADDVLAYAANLLGLSPPPLVDFDEAGLGPAARRFYAECKRVSNARAKAALGWRPAFPTYREGLADCLARQPAE